MDEPTAGVDPQERIRIRNFISEIAKDKIVILATHIVSDVESIAKEILLLKKGKIIEKGTPYELIVRFCGNLNKINDRIYLRFASYEEGIDITEDFVDGVATGKIKWSAGVLEERLEETFSYRVEGTLEDYTVDVWWVERE